MQSKLLHEADGKRTFAVILQNGDEAMRCLQDFAAKERLGGAQVTAIGALSVPNLRSSTGRRSNTVQFPSRSRSKSLPSSAISRWAPTANRASMCMRCWDGAMGPLWPGTCRRVT